MPFNVSESRHTTDREILAYPAGLDAIKSVLVASDGAATLSSAVTGEAVPGLLAGSILQPVSGDSAGRVELYDGTGPIVGILGSNLFFEGAGDEYDAPAEAYFHGCVFNKDRIVDFDTYETELGDELPTCRFE